MDRNLHSELEIRAVAEDGFDGTIRILNDLQRFGFSLSRLTMRKDDGTHPSFTLELTIASHPEVISGGLAGRLARHPGVLSVRTAFG